MRESIPYISYAMLQSKILELGLIGEDPDYTRALRMSARCADHSEPVLIIGERGVGKKAIARMIHELGRARPETLRVLDCSTISSRNCEDELFHRPDMPGSRTNRRKREGALFDPRLGSVYLEGFEYLAPRLQARVIGAIDRRLRQLRLGTQAGADAFPQEVLPRILLSVIEPATINRHAHGGLAEVCAEILRNAIRVPSLAERRSDVKLICEHVLNGLAPSKAARKRLSGSSERYLMHYTFARNVETLTDMLCHTVSNCDRPLIEPEDLESYTRVGMTFRPDCPLIPELNEGFSLERHMREVRAHIFLQALRKTMGNQSQAARLLNVSPQAVHQFVKTHGMPEGCHSLTKDTDQKDS